MRRLLILMLVGLPYLMQAQTVKDFPALKGEYFGLTPPGLIPEVFAPGIVSDSTWAEHCQVAVSPKGDEIYWSAWSSKYPPADTTMKNSEQIYFTEFKKGSWTKPALAEFTKDHLTNLNGGPVFSLDGNRLYFYSVDRPGGLGKMDTWYVEKIDKKWSKPINVGEQYNTKGSDKPPIFTKKGNAYSNWGPTIKYKYEKGEFTIQDTIIINKDFRPGWKIYISPMEDYVIFAARHESGFGDFDLYISFKTQNGTWGTPINMGNKINTELRERFPIVSPDGKYMFFMRHTPGQDFFWVSTDIIKDLKKQL